MPLVAASARCQRGKALCRLGISGRAAAEHQAAGRANRSDQLGCLVTPNSQPGNHQPSSIVSTLHAAASSESKLFPFTALKSSPGSNRETAFHARQNLRWVFWATQRRHHQIEGFSFSGGGVGAGLYNGECLGAPDVLTPHLSRQGMKAGPVRCTVCLLLAPGTYSRVRKGICPGFLLQCGEDN